MINKEKQIIDFQQWLDEKINEIKKKDYLPKLLIHSCCAPCSSYVLEYLSSFFSITVFYYNPNIHPGQEYKKRLNAQKKLIEQLPLKNKVRLIEEQYEPGVFFTRVKDLEQEREGKKRCLKCYFLRLEKTAEKSRALRYTYFTTTLTISPHKNARIINHFGHKIAQKYRLNYLYSDFKKKNGFKRSVFLANQYQIYRQKYCGCIFSAKNSVKNDY